MRPEDTELCESKTPVDDGGPAFPIQNRLDVSNSGMSMRDYLAAAAMTSGLCPCNAYDWKEIAGWSYGVADEMLKARIAE